MRSHQVSRPRHVLAGNLEAEACGADALFRVTGSQVVRDALSIAHRFGVLLGETIEGIALAQWSQALAAPGHVEHRQQAFARRGPPRGRSLSGHGAGVKLLWRGCSGMNPSLEDWARTRVQVGHHLHEPGPLGIGNELSLQLSGTTVESRAQRPGSPRWGQHDDPGLACGDGHRRPYPQYGADLRASGERAQVSQSIERQQRDDLTPILALHAGYPTTLLSGGLGELRQASAARAARVSSMLQRLAFQGPHLGPYLRRSTELAKRR